MFINLSRSNTWSQDLFFFFFFSVRMLRIFERDLSRAFNVEFLCVLFITVERVLVHGLQRKTFEVLMRWNVLVNVQIPGMLSFLRSSAFPPKTIFHSERVPSLQLWGTERSRRGHARVTVQPYTPVLFLFCLNSIFVKDFHLEPRRTVLHGTAWDAVPLCTLSNEELSWVSWTVKGSSTPKRVLWFVLD